jgi:hypothetical protein
MNPQLKLTQYSELAVVLVLDPCHCEHILWAYPHTIGLALTAIEVNDRLDDACRLVALGNSCTHELLSNCYGIGIPRFESGRALLALESEDAANGGLDGSLNLQKPPNESCSEPRDGASSSMPNKTFQNPKYCAAARSHVTTQPVAG